MKLLALALVAGALGCAQTVPKLEFEVASIKASNAPEGSYTSNTSQGRLHLINYSLRRMILAAYQVSDAQLTGGPKWLDSERFDVDAKPPAAAKNAQLFEMLKALLADRFQLKLHPERREVSGYALFVAKGGMKIQASAEEGGAQSSAGNGKMQVKLCRMDKIAEMLQRDLRVPVSDQTGVQGAFTFSLEWSPDSKPDATLPSLFTALQEQLGLRLEGRKVMADVLVVDSAEKPSEN